ncbi:MAG: hypothetical protein J1F38_10865 [Muribaculaceae bacterium]|nr:hypothetical protein [Muribaculaceae bacterium]
MAKKIITKELREALSFIPQIPIPDELKANVNKLNIKYIYEVKDYNLSKFSISGNYVIELPNSEFIDIVVIPDNIESIIKLLT